MGAEELHDGTVTTTASGWFRWTCSCGARSKVEVLARGKAVASHRSHRTAKLKAVKA